jgi:hypothetical protein
MIGDLRGSSQWCIVRFGYCRRVPFGVVGVLRYDVVGVSVDGERQIAIPNPAFACRLAGFDTIPEAASINTGPLTELDVP